MPENDLQAERHLFVFDKDGTICKSVVNPKTGKSHAPNALEQQEYWEDVLLVTQQLKKDGHILAVASNQGGVAFGIFSDTEAEQLVRAAAEYIGASSHRVCFHHPKGKVRPYDTESPNRKPAPGMLLSLMEQFHVTPDQTTMIGDWDTDKQAAEAAGCAFEWAHEFFGRVNPFADRMHAVWDAAKQGSGS